MSEVAGNEFSLSPLFRGIRPRHERKRVETDENGSDQNNNSDQGTKWHQIKPILSDSEVFYLSNESNFEGFGGVCQKLQSSERTEVSFMFYSDFLSDFRRIFMVRLGYFF